MGVNDKFATEQVARDHKAALRLNNFERTRIFNQFMDFPVRDGWTDSIPVSERILEGKMLVEEVLETLEAMGLRLDLNANRDGLEVVHVEGSRYDPIKTADGLADIKVIANGTAAKFGIPMPAVDLEVWASNMTKLDENGKPLINECVSVPCETRIAGFTCDNPFHLRDPNQPMGKRLKPEHYTPANIERLYYEYTKKGV